MLSWPGGSGFGRGMVGAAPTTPPGLRQLAAQTGGFAYVNKNDLQAGMEKVSRNWTNTTSWVCAANPAHDGSIKNSREGGPPRRGGPRPRRLYRYQEPEPAGGKPEGQVLESRAASTEAGGIPSASLPHTFTSARRCPIT